jgi:hypothetical protein
MKILNLLLIKIKSYCKKLFVKFTIKSVISSQNLLNLKKIKVGFNDNEIFISLFISNKIHEIFENNVVISKIDFKNLLKKLNDVKNITNVIIDPPIKINDNPIIKIIRIVLKYE